ncbi:MAG: hypothetical protein ACREON_00950 [Gemmatimonadaceae bacterium]
MKYATARLLIAVVGIAIWGYGTRVGDPRLQWGGIAVVAVAVIMKLFGKRPV